MRRSLEWLGVALSVVVLLIPLGARARKAEGQRQLRQCCTNLKNIGTALENYSTDYSGRYPRVGPFGGSIEEIPLTMLSPGYLETVPTCPTGEAYRVVTGV